MTATYRRIYDTLSPAEIAELMGQDPRFALPPGSRDAAERMRQAMAIMRREGRVISTPAAERMVPNE